MNAGPRAGLWQLSGEGKNVLHCSSKTGPACGVSAELVALVEALGLASLQEGRLVTGEAPADPVRVRLAALALQLGLMAEELAELLALYDASAGEERRLSRFVALLATYRRYIDWRKRAGPALPC